MRKVQVQMDKTHQIKDPKERQRLIAEYMQAMQDMMQTMHGMNGPMMADMMDG